MKKYISFMLLIAVSGIVVGSQTDESQSPKGLRVRFSSDITVGEVFSPITTRNSSESDASTGSLSPKSFGFHRRHYPGYLPKVTLTADDMKPVEVVVDPGATYDLFTDRLDSSLSPEEFRDIKRQVTKDALAEKAPLYKKCLVWLGCTPHLGSLKSE